MLRRRFRTHPATQGTPRRRPRTPAHVQHSHQWTQEVQTPAMLFEIRFSCGHTLSIAADTEEELTENLNRQPDSLCPGCETAKYGKRVHTWGIAPDETYMILPHGMQCPCCATIAEEEAEDEAEGHTRRPSA